jgi:hypothetical protein
LVEIVNPLLAQQSREASYWSVGVEWLFSPYGNFSPPVLRIEPIAFYVADPRFVCRFDRLLSRVLISNPRTDVKLMELWCFMIQFIESPTVPPQLDTLLV